MNVMLAAAARQLRGADDPQSAIQPPWRGAQLRTLVNASRSGLQGTASTRRDDEKWDEAVIPSQPLERGFFGESWRSSRARMLPLLTEAASAEPIASARSHPFGT
jgi:hypothetical protein